MKVLKFLFTGIFFGIVLTKSQAVSWYRIVEMFRFESFHMYGIIGSAVVTGLILLQLSKKMNLKTTEGNPINLPEKEKKYKSALLGGTIFGVRLGISWSLSWTNVHLVWSRILFNQHYNPFLYSWNFCLWLSRQSIALNQFC